MLIDINLLPEKKVKKRTSLYLIAGILAAAILFGIILIFQVNSQKAHLKTLDAKLQEQKQIEITMQKRIKTFETSDSFQQLDQAVKWAESYPVKTGPVLDKLTALLPERGFFNEFGYAEDGTVSLRVQFDSESQAAYYLDRLKKADWISDANIMKLSTSQIDDTNKGSANLTATAGADNVLPRYIASYEIKLNKSIIQSESDESSEVEGDEQN
ncbi:PilN domain-containing protein [Falsibacillus albus]|uniref:Fimbrial assembly protein n=1 Tax=Falsibacillus albus TaxID=2478915 RepID=A0A3L7K4R1_9BACI|nr:PilN domain-containing protein [Falsibacillus albus]RLQ98053.1 hypothetical protein D9X91_01300 [Falsibacillus albus]